MSETWPDRLEHAHKVAEQFRVERDEARADLADAQQTAATLEAQTVTLAAENQDLYRDLANAQRERDAALEQARNNQWLYEQQEDDVRAYAYLREEGWAKLMPEDGYDGDEAEEVYVLRWMQDMARALSAGGGGPAEGVEDV